jgi:hypothetical protein
LDDLAGLRLASRRVLRSGNGSRFSARSLDPARGAAAPSGVGQAITALVLAAQGSTRPWLAAGAWWTVYGTVADLGCLALMAFWLKREGGGLSDLIGRIRRFRDLVAGLGFFFLVMPLFLGAALLAALTVYGSLVPAMPPHVLAERVLPAWAVIYSLSVWWLVWSPCEEMTYQSFAFARLSASTGSALPALLLVGGVWALQHSVLPVIDLRFALWRFLAFFPGCVVLLLLYARSRRLAPLIVAHWPMDMIAAATTLQFS